MTRNIDDIIRRQVASWEQRQRESKTRAPVSKTQQPVITVSGLHGAYTSEVGEMVAEQLGFDLFDRQLVGRIAESAQVRQQVIESLDEQDQNLFTEYITTQFKSNTFTSSDYLRHLSKVVLTIGQHGKAVIVGRGAHHILANKRTLRARIVAPLDLRIRRVAEQDGLDEKKARALVLQEDADRIAYCRLHFDREVSYPLLYDLVLNTAFATKEQAARLVVQAFRDRFLA